MTTQRERIRAKKAEMAAQRAAARAPDADGYQFYSGYQALNVVSEPVWMDDMKASAADLVRRLPHYTAGAGEDQQ